MGGRGGPGRRPELEFKAFGPGPHTPPLRISARAPNGPLHTLTHTPHRLRGLVPVYFRAELVLSLKTFYFIFRKSAYRRAGAGGLLPLPLDRPLRAVRSGWS